MPMPAVNISPRCETNMSQTDKLHKERIKYSEAVEVANTETRTYINQYCEASDKLIVTKETLKRQRLH